MRNFCFQTCPCVKKYSKFTIKKKMKGKKVPLVKNERTCKLSVLSFCINNHYIFNLIPAFQEFDDVSIFDNDVIMAAILG